MSVQLNRRWVASVFVDEPVHAVFTGATAGGSAGALADFFNAGCAVLDVCTNGAFTNSATDTGVHGVSVRVVSGEKQGVILIIPCNCNDSGSQ